MANPIISAGVAGCKGGASAGSTADAIRLIRPTLADGLLKRGEEYNNNRRARVREEKNYN